MIWAMDPTDIEIAPLLDAQPSRLLSQVALTVTRSTAQALERLDAHRNHFAVLATLQAFGPQSQAELSRRTGVDRSDIVAAIDQLERDKTVSRAVDPTDRRQNIITLTSVGEARLEELAGALERAQAAAFAPLSQTEMADLVSMLGRLREHHRRPVGDDAGTS